MDCHGRGDNGGALDALLMVGGLTFTNRNHTPRVIGKSSKWHQSPVIDVTVALPSPRWGVGTPLSSLRMCDDTSKAVGRRSSANAHHYRQK